MGDAVPELRPEDLKDTSIGEEFMKWAEQYWRIDKAYEEKNTDGKSESCPYSYVRSVFRNKINDMIKEKIL